MKLFGGMKRKKVMRKTATLLPRYGSTKPPAGCLTGDVDFSAFSEWINANEQAIERLRFADPVLYLDLQKTLREVENKRSSERQRFLSGMNQRPSGVSDQEAAMMAQMLVRQYGFTEPTDMTDGVMESHVFLAWLIENEAAIDRMRATRPKAAIAIEQTKKALMDELHSR